MCKGKKCQVNISYTAFPIYSDNIFYGVSPGGSMVKNLMPRQEMKETQVQSLNWEDHLQEEMATCPSILALEIPGIEELSGLQFMRLQRVRRN